MIIINEKNIKKLAIKYNAQFYIEIISTEVTDKIIENVPCILGQITIGDFQESFPMALEYWSSEDYAKQWQEAFDRLETHNTSCLLAYIQDPEKCPFINWWPIYKQGKKIHVRNQLLFYHNYKKKIDLTQPFTINNWHKFIPKRYIKKKVSEWIVDANLESSKH